jgi:multimeric flavodoxin WrbA
VVGFISRSDIVLIDMDAVILDGSESGDGTSSQIRAVLTKELSALGHSVRPFLLSGMDIADCTGCFGCWMETPGRCVLNDDCGEVASALARADIVALVAPVTFGGYSSALKKALDRSICFSLPYLTIRKGEVHHPRRYGHEQRLMGIGIMWNRDLEAQVVFSELIARNALNMDIQHHASALVFREEQQVLIGATIKEAMIQAGLV